MNANMAVIPFQFQTIALQESCWIEGTPYFTRRAIGEWLEYNDPQNAIDIIIKRNPHIDDDAWSTPVNLTGVEGDRAVTREVRVYDPIGMQLIVFESRQPKAIAYKIAVAHLVVAFRNGTIKPSKWTLRGDLVSAGRQIHSIKPCIARGGMMRDLAERDGCSVATIYRRLQRATGMRLRKGVRQDRGQSRFPNEKAKAFTYVAAHPDAKGSEIRKALKLTISSSRINAWLRESKNLI